MMRIYKAFIVNRILAIFLFWVFFFIGFIVLCVLLDAFVHNDDLLVLLLFVLLIAIGIGSYRLAQRLAATTRLITVENGQVQLRRLTGNALDSVINVADIQSCQPIYKGDSYGAVILHLFDGRKIKLRRRLFRFYELQEFDGLPAFLSASVNSSKVKDTGIPQTPQETVYSDLPLPALPPSFKTNQLPLTFKAKKINLLVLIIGVFLFMANANVFTYTLSNALSRSYTYIWTVLLLGGAELLLVFLLLKKFCSDHLDVTVHTDRLVIIQLKNFITGIDKITAFSYRDMSDLFINTNKNFGIGTQVVIRTKGGQVYSIVYKLPYAPGSTQVELAECLKLAFEEFTTKNNTSGKITIINKWAWKIH